MSKNMKVHLKRPIYLAGALAVSLALALLLSGCFGGIGRPTGSVAGYIIVPTSETRGANIRLTPQLIPTPGDGYRYGEGARILVQSGSWSGTATADNIGYFNVPGVPTGTARVTVTYGSYRVETTVYVRANETNLIGDPNQGFRLRKWTVMVYMCADNNMGNLAEFDLQEMEGVGSTLNVSIVAQLDGPGRGDTVRYYIAQTGRERVDNWGNRELDMGNPDTLADFVSWAKQNYPAQNYLLVLWNHGDGWQIYQRSTRSFNQVFQRAICFDCDGTVDTIKTALNVDEIPRALGGSNNVDVLAMDACLMQMAEVAYEVKDVARVMVGSEELAPGEGYPYNGILTALTGNPAMSPRELAVKICREFEISAPNPFPTGGTYRPTQSAINLAKVFELAQRLKDVTETIASADASEYSGQLKNVLNAARSSAKEFGKGPNLDYYSFDLYQFVDYIERALRNEPPNSPLGAVCRYAGAVRDFFDSSDLIYYNYSAEAGPGGLAIYIPPNGRMSPYYPSMRFVGYTRWNSIFQYIN